MILSIFISKFLHLVHFMVQIKQIKQKDFKMQRILFLNEGMIRVTMLLSYKSKMHIKSFHEILLWILFPLDFRSQLARQIVRIAILDHLDWDCWILLEAFLKLPSNQSGVLCELNSLMYLAGTQASFGSLEGNGMEWNE